MHCFGIETAMRFFISAWRKDKEVARVLDKLVVCLHAEKKSKEAEPHCNRALKIYGQTIGEESRFVASTVSALARLQMDKDKLNEAEVTSTRARTLFEKTYGKRDVNSAVALASLAEIKAKNGEKEEADVLFNRSK